MRRAPTVSPRAEARRLAGAGAALVVVAAIACAWWTAWPGAFQFDDYAVIVDEPRAHGLAAWWASMPGLRPLLKASYALSWHAGGGQPAAFLVLNIALHTLNALLVLALARCVIPWIAPDVAVRPERVALGALAVALVFALHPAQAESVTYLSGRSNALMATFWLAALVGWLRDTRAARTVACLMFVAAVATKETALTWPLAVLLLEGARRPRWRDALRACVVPFIVAIGCAAAIALLPAYQRMAGASLGTRGPLENLAAQVDGIAYLVGMPLLTLRTNIDPQITLTAFAPVWWLEASLIAATLGFALAALRRDSRGGLRRPVAGVAIAWFALAIAPTNSWIARFDIANDRQLYLALLGPALALGVGVARWRAGRPLVALLAVALGAATVARNADYASEVTLWQATARASPAKSRVFNNLGYALQQRGQLDAARAAYARALELDPGDFKARTNLELLRRSEAPPRDG